MTIPRQERKPVRKPLLRRDLVIGGAALLAAQCAAPFAGYAAPTGIIVTDERSGLAIYGFDPVAYFTAAVAEPGRPEFEWRYAGAVWRFRNPGNRSAFAANAEVYMPRYGGHDPISVGRGTSAAGHPQLWLISGQRLYLFHHEDARRAFAENPDRTIEAAERHWPAVLGTLVP